MPEAVGPGVEEVAEDEITFAVVEVGDRGSSFVTPAPPLWRRGLLLTQYRPPPLMSNEVLEESLGDFGDWGDLSMEFVVSEYDLWRYLRLSANLSRS